ncbi:unnamed protein product [Cylicocyclus nassatus]|uniref:Major capsid protein n=1 Tax=Cylicocyclus nassatus TaxID=53992 RepID=A0AA36M3C3_CYLNA|nr:unnamed protein product [Cylicocyclus nassatus]CAJ0596495.1 unnamed protein product [Cylicocyclus nassatus]
MNHDFGRVPLTDAPRSTFDRSHGYKTCFNSGKLIPIEVQEVLPGDEVKMDANIFARLSQTVTPVMDNVFLDIHWFYVPSRLLWTNFVRMMGERPNPKDSIDYTVPVINSGEFGFDIGSLADYFGIPTGVANLDVNVLPFRAYAKIWDDWYRDTNLQDSIINVEQDLGDSNPNSIDWNKLLPRGKKKDYFTSCLPSPQRGDAVTVPLGSTAPVYGINGVPLQLVSYDTTDPSYSDKVFPVKATGGGESSTLSATNNPEYGGTGDALNGQYLRIASKGELVSYPAQLEADLSAAANVSVNSLRTAFQLQRLLETDARAGNRLQRSEYLGGESKIIGMSVVSQTSATGDSTTPQGNMVANGTGKSVTDVNDGSVVDDKVFGYQERYAEYRYNPSVITGKMRSSAADSLDVWHLSQYFSELPTLSAEFIEDNPPLARIMAVPSEPEIILDAYLAQKWTRAMPVYSVPGLIDHL